MGTQHGYIGAEACMYNCFVCTAACAAEQAVGGLSDTLEMPTPYAAADVIVHDDSGRLSFHYAIVEVNVPSPVQGGRLRRQPDVLQAS